MKKLVKLPSLSRVSPGNTATLEFPLGPTYERVIFTVAASAGLDASDIGRITLLLNGQPVQTFKNLERLIDLNKYYGRGADSVAATGIQFALHFSRRELVDNIWRNAPGIGTKDVQTMHMEIEIASGAPSDIAITAHAQVDPTQQALGVFTRIREFPASTSVSGEFEHDKLPRQGFYSVIHVFKSDANKVVLEANGVTVVDATKEVLERFQKEANTARVPQTAKATHIDFVTDGTLADSLPAASLQDLRLKLTLATSGSMDIVTETLDTL
jgi:hypothetical protein